MAVVLGKRVPGALSGFSAIDSCTSHALPHNTARAGFEADGVTWQDSQEIVTVAMPISRDCLRSLDVHTDGFTLQISWGKGQVSSLAGSTPRACDHVYHPR